MFSFSDRMNKVSRLNFDKGKGVMKILKDDRGFTLVEIMIVTVIMGIFTLGIFEFFDFQTKTFKVEEMISTISQAGHASINVIDRDIQMAETFYIALGGDNEKPSRVNGIIQFIGDVDGSGDVDIVHYQLEFDVDGMGTLYRGVIFDPAPTDIGLKTFSLDPGVSDFLPNATTQRTDRVANNVESLNFKFYEQSNEDIINTNIILLNGGVDVDSDGIKDSITDQGYRDAIRGVEIVLVVRSKDEKTLIPGGTFVSDNPLTPEVETDSYIRRLFRTRLEPRTLNLQPITEAGGGESPCGVLKLDGPSTIISCEADNKYAVIKVTTMKPTTSDGKKIPTNYGTVFLNASYTGSAVSRCADAACATMDNAAELPIFYRENGGGTSTDLLSDEGNSLTESFRDATTGEGYIYVKVDADQVGNSFQVFATWLTPQTDVYCEIPDQLTPPPITITVEEGGAGRLNLAGTTADGASLGADKSLIVACPANSDHPDGCSTDISTLIKAQLTDMCYNPLNNKSVTFTVDDTGVDGSFNATIGEYTKIGPADGAYDGVYQAELHSPDSVSDAEAIVTVTIPNPNAPTTVSNSITVPVGPCQTPYELVLKEPASGTWSGKPKNCPGQQEEIQFRILDACGNFLPGRATEIELTKKILDKGGIEDTVGKNATLSSITMVPPAGGVQGYYRVTLSTPDNGCFLKDPYSVVLDYSKISDPTRRTKTVAIEPVECPGPSIVISYAPYMDNGKQLPTYYGTDTGGIADGMEVGCSTNSETEDDVKFTVTVSTSCKAMPPGRIIFVADNPNDSNETKAIFSNKTDRYDNKPTTAVSGNISTADAYLNSGTIRLDPTYPYIDTASNNIAQNDDTTTPLIERKVVLQRRLRVQAFFCHPGGDVDDTPLDTLPGDTQCSTEDISYPSNVVELYLGSSQAGFDGRDATGDLVTGNIGLFNSIARDQASLLNNQVVAGQLPCSADVLYWGLHTSYVAESPTSGCKIPVLQMPASRTERNQAYLEVKDCDKNITNGLDQILVSAFSVPKAFGSINQTMGDIYGDWNYNFEEHLDGSGFFGPSDQIILYETGTETGIFRGYIEYGYPGVLPSAMPPIPDMVGLSCDQSTGMGEFMFDYTNNGYLGVTYGNTIIFKYLDDLVAQEEALTEAVASGVRFITPTNSSGTLLSWFGAYHLGPEPDATNITNSTGDPDSIPSCTWDDGGTSFNAWDDKVTCTRHTVMPAIYIPEHSRYYGNTETGQTIIARISSEEDLDTDGYQTNDGDGEDFFTLREMNISGRENNEGIFRIDSGTDVSVMYRYNNQNYIFVTNDPNDVTPGTGNNVNVSFGLDETPNNLLIDYSNNISTGEVDNQLKVCVQDVDVPTITIDSAGGTSTTAAWVDGVALSTDEFGFLRIEGTINDGLGTWGVQDILVSINGGSSFTEQATKIDVANDSWYIDFSSFDNLVSDGVYSIQAKALDDSSNVGFSGTFEFLLNNEPDNVVILEPFVNSVHCGQITFTVDTSSIKFYPDTAEMTLSVDLYDGSNNLISNLQTEQDLPGSTYSYTYDTLAAPFNAFSGITSYTVKATVDDVGGDPAVGPYEAFVGFVVDNAPPVANIVSPTAGSIQTGSFTVQVEAEDSCGLNTSDISVQVYNVANATNDNAIVTAPYLISCTQYHAVNSLCTIGTYGVDVRTEGNPRSDRCTFDDGYMADGIFVVYEVVVDASIDPTTTSAMISFNVDNPPQVDALVAEFGPSFGGFALPGCLINDASCLGVRFAAYDCDGMLSTSIRAKLEDPTGVFENMLFDNAFPQDYAVLENALAPASVTCDTPTDSSVICDFSVDTDYSCTGMYDPDALYDGIYTMYYIADDNTPATAGNCDPSTSPGSLNDCSSTMSSPIDIDNPPVFVSSEWAKIDPITGTINPWSEPNLYGEVHVLSTVTDCDAPNTTTRISMELYDNFSGTILSIWNSQKLYQTSGADFTWEGSFQSENIVPFGESSMTMMPPVDIQVNLTADDGTFTTVTDVLPPHPGGIDNRWCSMPFTPTYSDTAGTGFRIQGEILGFNGMPVTNGVLVEVWADFYDPALMVNWGDEIAGPRTASTRKIKQNRGAFRVDLTVPFTPTAGSTEIRYYIRVVEDPESRTNCGNVNSATDLSDVLFTGTVFYGMISECSDGLDNDMDGFIDWPADIDCFDALDTAEFGLPPECSDGLDNDGDTFTDFPDDTGCSDALDTSELF